MADPFAQDHAQNDDKSLMFKLFFTLIFIYLSHSVCANGVNPKQLEQKFDQLINNSNVKEALKVSKQIRDDLKKIAESEKKKPTKKKMVPADTQANLDMEICIGCNEISNLTSTVNEILSRTKEAQDPTSSVSLELNNLIAVTTIVQNIKDDEVDCYRMRDLSLTEEFVQIDESDLVLEFSEEIDQHFVSGQFYNRATEHKTIWLRGTGDDLDKVIRVDIDKYNNKTLSYYRLKSVDPTIVPRELKKENEHNLPSLGVNEEIEAPSFEDKTSGQISLAGDFEWSSNDNKDYLKMTVGPELDYKYYIPKNVKVLSIEAENEFFDQYLVRSDVKVTAKDQEAEIKLMSGNDQKERLKLKIDNSKTVVDIPYDQELIDVYAIKGKVQSDSIKGESVKASLYDTTDNNVLFNVTAREEKIDLGIPYEQDIYDTYNVQGIIGTDTLGTHRMTASVRDGQSEMFNTQYTQHANGNQSIAIGTTQKVSSNGTLSIKLKRDIIAHQERDGIWVNYEMKF